MTSELATVRRCGTWYNNQPMRIGKARLELYAEPFTLQATDGTAVEYLLLYERGLSLPTWAIDLGADAHPLHRLRS
jgi:hypothetical protein